MSHHNPLDSASTSTHGAPPPPVAGISGPGDLMDRFLARLIDGVLLGVVYSVLFAVLGAILIVRVSIDPETGEIHDGSSLLFYLVLGVTAAASSLAYYAIMESNRGATIGKQILKLRVYGPDGFSHPSLAEAIRRNIFTAAPIGYVIPAFGPALAGLAILVAEILIAVNIDADPAKRQGWHDKFAGGTTVMKLN